MRTRPTLERSYEEAAQQLPQNAQTVECELRLPEQLACLLEPATTQPGGGRFKVIHGGRGSAKSMSIARALLTRGLERKLKILCAREIQNSIKDSVHALLKHCIDDMNYGKFYEVQANGIVGLNGTEFIFKGMRANASEIKSMQGVDICWVEEADKVSAASWKYLIPTIRAEYEDGTCSEIIISLNPELEEDYTYQEFIVDPPSSAIVVQMNWRDNPWFPAVLQAERVELWNKAQQSRRKMDEYMWIWEGRCKAAVEGAVYAEELAIATAQGRITEVPHTKGTPVDTYWDLGRSDATAVVLVQRAHQRRNIINYYENTGHHISHYLEWLQQTAEAEGYVYGTHHLPHDADNKLVGQIHSVGAQVRADGLRRVRIIPRPPRKANGINAGRTVFSISYFDREKCDVLLGHARRYHYGVSEKGVRTLEPVHDEHSNAMDAWQTLGLADLPVVKVNPTMPRTTSAPSGSVTGTGWMRS